MRYAGGNEQRSGDETNGTMATSSTGGTIETNSQLFDSKAYLKSRFSAPNGVINDDNRGAMSKFFLQCCHDFNRKFHKEWSTNDARLLELGGGPSIYPLISAAPNVSEIVFTDYSDSHLQQILLWKNKDGEAHDWSPFIRHVVNNLEGVADPDAPVQREEEIRKKITQILHCNILVECPDNIVVGGPHKPFDIVSSNFCMETVSESLSQCEEVLRKVSSLLKPRGFLASLVAEEESWWIVGSNKRRHLYLTEQNTLDCFQKAGFTVRYSSHFLIPEQDLNTFDDRKAIRFIVAQRNL